MPSPGKTGLRVIDYSDSLLGEVIYRGDGQSLSERLRTRCKDCEIPQCSGPEGTYKDGKEKAGSPAIVALPHKQIGIIGCCETNSALPPKVGLACPRGEIIEIPKSGLAEQGKSSFFCLETSVN